MLTAIDAESQRCSLVTHHEKRLNLELWSRVDGALRRAYAWGLGWADRPSGPGILVLLALLEATLFPAPTEAMLVALALGHARRAWWLGALAVGASAAGGLGGYWIGAASFDSIGQPLLASFGLLEHLDTVAALYGDHTFVALATSGYTPIPYLLYTIAAGAFDSPLAPFVAGSIVGRSLKYLPILVLLYIFGPRIRQVLDRYASWAAGAFLALLVVWLVLVA